MDLKNPFGYSLSVSPQQNISSLNAYNPIVAKITARFYLDKILKINQTVLLEESLHSSKKPSLFTLVAVGVN